MFFLSKNTTQHLHIHKFSITGAQILFYKWHIKKLTHSHFCSYCCSIFGAKHMCAPVSNNVKLWTKCEKMCRSQCELVQYVNVQCCICGEKKIYMYTTRRVCDHTYTITVHSYKFHCYRCSNLLHQWYLHVILAYLPLRWLKLTDTDVFDLPSSVLFLEIQLITFSFFFLFFKL